MGSGVLNKMTGEELLLLAILSHDSADSTVEAELDRRSLPGGGTRPAGAGTGGAGEALARKRAGNSVVAA